jgi:nicotinate-nucleotide adenylyltransferase
MRLGIYGGSFDPVHHGHLALARACQRQAGLDEVWFMPTAVQPLKRHGPQASDAQRVEMLELATREVPSWRVSTLEIERGGKSYTVDTLRQLNEDLPEAVLFFLMGADAVREVPQWREPEEIFRLAAPLVVRRAGEVEPDMQALQAFAAANKQPRLLEMPGHAISSSDIRRRIAAGEPIVDLVPSAVAALIAAHRLYRD